MIEQIAFSKFMNEPTIESEEFLNFSKPQIWAERYFLAQRNILEIDQNTQHNIGNPKRDLTFGITVLALKEKLEVWMIE